MGSINLRGEPYKKLCLELKIMPLRQAVRPRILIPVFAGSNPAGVVS